MTFISHLKKNKKKANAQTAENLRLAGAHIGENFHNYGKIDTGHAYLFTAGNDVTLAEDALILTHDASTQFEFGLSKVGRVELGDKVFIGARAIVLPNVKIGSKCIIGAGSVVTHDIPGNSVACGNPAKRIGSYDDYIEKCRQMMQESPIFTKYWKEKTEEDKDNEYRLLKDGGFGFDK